MHQMKKLLLALGCMAFTLITNAQIKALTESGDEVLLNKDGTWKYASVSQGWNTKLDTTNVKKDAAATFLVKGKRIKYGVYIDPKKWSFNAEKDEKSPVEYEFTLKQEDAYAMVIPEGMEMSYEGLVKIALNNAKEAAPDAHITSEETRRVNGNIVRMVEIHGTVESIKFVYLGYYYTGKSGTVQLISYTGENMIDKYRKEMETLLNGFTTNVN